MNTAGSYYCQCPPSFALASDGKTCIECGTNNLAINTGRSGKVHRRKFSWHVQLCINTTSNNSSFLCSGSLINDQWVLTSAECICGLDYSSILVYFQKLAKCPLTQNMEVVRTISDVYCRNKNKNKIVDYNIALLKLSVPVDINGTYPICLPKDTTIRRGFSNTVNDVFVTGWGPTSHLHYAKLSTVPSDICKKSYGGEYDIDANSVCTGKIFLNPYTVCTHVIIPSCLLILSWYCQIDIAMYACLSLMLFRVILSIWCLENSKTVFVRYAKDFATRLIEHIDTVINSQVYLRTQVCSKIFKFAMYI